MRNRRVSSVTSALVIGVFSAACLFAGGKKEEPEPATLAISVGALSTPHQAGYKAGAEAFGKAVGHPVDVLAAKADTEGALADIRAEVARTGGNVVFFIDPRQEADDLPIAQFLDQAGVYFVTWGKKPSDLKVWNYRHWVAHISFDGVAAGYFTATELFKTFKTPNQGKVIAIQGPPAATRSAELFQGFQKALTENPGVQLEQSIAVDGDRTTASSQTRDLFGAHPGIDGVWCATDEMALGAIQALKEAGSTGKVMVTGADGIPEMIDAIKVGTAVATVMNDPKYLASLGLAMALAARQGKLDVSAQPRKYRQFEISAVNVDTSNVNQVVHDYVENTPDYDMTDFYARWSAAIP